MATCDRWHHVVLANVVKQPQELVRRLPVTDSGNRGVVFHAQPQSATTTVGKGDNLLGQLVGMGPSPLNRFELVRAVLPEAEGLRNLLRGQVHGTSPAAAAMRGE